MGKKKFIDKKKSATFCLLARDSSDPIYTEEPENDRVFVRVDNNSVSIGGLDENPDHGSDYENDPNSIFADAPEDVDCDYEFGAQTRAPMQSVGGSATLPDHIRKEIIELGFPDDGYNYLTHLREIRNTGGGSSYYENPKANLNDLPNDVKAYDASRVRIKETIDDTSPKVLYNVAEKTVNVRVKKVDAEIAKLLEENDSDFGSDIEDLEEDFVVQANFADDSETEDIYAEKGSTSFTKTQEEELYKSDSVTLKEFLPRAPTRSTVEMVQCFTEKPRVERLLDEQFDLLERQEYGTDSDDDGDSDDFLAQEDSSLAEKLSHVLIKGRKTDDLYLDGKYEVPADLKEDGKVVSSASDIVSKCVEYAEKYENEDEDGQEFVIVEESSDESEIWDCETIVTTYSNLDNHPGRITTPGYTRKKKLAETLSGALRSIGENTISLGGKAKLPVDYLPQGRKTAKEKVKVVEKFEQPKRNQESKEEKKERKAAVKEERREARRLKKDTKGLYRDEAKLAQKVAAVSGPSSIHL